MISAGLEKLIWQGKATFKNYSYAFGQTGGIPIPENKLCIICGFKFFPCLLVNGEDSRLNVAPNVFLLRIESDKNVNDYVIRCQRLASGDDFFLTSAENFEAYIIALNNIQIRIAHIPANIDGTITFTNGTPPPEAVEPDNPLGYATNNIVLSVDNANVNYRPLAERDNTTIGDRNQFNVNFNFDTLPNLKDSQTRYVNNGYPIINFSLVYIERAYMSEILSSK